MNKIILTTAAMSLGIMFAVAGTARAEGRSTTFKPMQTNSAVMKFAPTRGGTGAASSSGPAWTAGCYAEFGPKAKYPDAAMLEKCLNW